MPDPIHRLLFVCLGNICRSPLAEGIFIHRAGVRGVADRFDVDSCGTGDWHVGSLADPRSIAIGKTNGVELLSRARQFAASDGDQFDLMLAMDRQNRRDLIAMGAPEGKIKLMRSYDPSLASVVDERLDVPDPYYGGDDGFEDVYHMLVRACDGLLDLLLDGPMDDVTRTS